MADGLTPLAIAGLQAALHAIRMLANSGLVSPEDVDRSLEGVTATLETLPPDLIAQMQVSLDPILSEIKQAAAANYRGLDD